MKATKETFKDMIMYAGQINCTWHLPFEELNEEENTIKVYSLPNGKYITGEHLEDDWEKYEFDNYKLSQGWNCDHTTARIKINQSATIPVH